MRLRPCRLPLLLLAACITLPAAALDTARLDPATRANDDLFRAANGAWLAATAIPAERSEVYGADLPASVNARVRAIVDGLRAHPQAPGSIERKLVDFHDSVRDLAAIDRAGLAPLRAQLDAIVAIRTVDDLAVWQGQVQGILRTPLWLWGGLADFKDPTRNRVLVMQGGLGLPERDYYLGQDARLLAARAAYLRYLETLAQLAGEPQPQAAARRVLALETRLAQAHVPAAEAMNPAHVRSLDAHQLAQRAPGLAWDAFLQASAIPDGHAVNVVQPAAAGAIAALQRDLPLDDWKLYFRLRLLDVSAPLLPAPFRAAHFEFRGKALGGQPAPMPQDERALDALTEALGDGLGALYMARHFPPGHKARVEAMTAQLQRAASEAVVHIPWLGTQARKEAQAKIAGMRAKVGYPATWRDYGTLAIEPGDALGNRNRARRHEWLRLAALSGTAVERGAWAMSPLEANAFYDPMLNEINLPAAILQAPFFDAAADDASNYGGIGALIAHEISHAFDATGSQFDSRGVQRDWWTAADHAAFDAFGKGLAARFDALEALPGTRVNGRLTLSENMADLMGLQLAWRAYQHALGGKPAPVIGGRSGAQRFFLAYAQQWAVKRRDERTLQLLTSDPHAPPGLRANFPAMQLDAFHDAFGTRPGDAMYLAPAARLRVW